MSDLLKMVVETLRGEDVITDETASLLVYSHDWDNNSRNDALTLEEIRLVSQLRHIPAIKEIRSRLGMSLKDSKYLADECRLAMGVYHKSENQYEKYIEGR